MGFFSSDKEENPGPVIHETPWGPENRQKIQGLVNADIEYPTRQIAGMSDLEQAGQSILASIVSGASFADPAESAVYKSYRTESEREEERGASQLKRGAQASGMAGSSRAKGVESRYREGMSNQRLGLLGQLYEAERNRDNPYTRLAAASTYGALPRQIEQGRLDAEYSTELQDLLAPYQLQAPLAKDLLNYQPWYQPTFTTSPSAFSQITGAAASIGGLVAPFFMGGGGGMNGGGSGDPGILGRLAPKAKTGSVTTTHMG